MSTNDISRSSRKIGWWLLLGVFMIMVQVVLGGITRLTGSGLSITEWEPLLGVFPPRTPAAWQEAFERYQQIGQYKQLNFYFSLEDFQFIYFWEWFHRLWARLLAVAFLVPFIYFLVRGTFQRSMILPMFYLFLLGGLQGFIGWIMVKSGLNPDDLYVSHYRLAIHFLTAVVLLCYTLWFALRLLLPFSIFPPSRPLLIFPWILVPLLILQLIYGAFMAGLKAAAVAPTWPSLNGHWWISLQGVALTNDPLAVQFIHRLLAYGMVLIHVFWWWRVRKVAASSHQKRFLHLPVYLVLVQLGLGIATVHFSGNRHSLLVWGTLHQFSAMLLVLAWMTILYVQFVPRPAR